MTKKIPLNEAVPLSPGLAARMIAASLGEPEGTWGLRLTNWRRPERRSAVNWRENDAGRPVYDFADVQAYIDQTLAQRAAVTQPDTGTGKAKATATADIENNVPFVRVFWNAGTAQGGFSLSTGAAKDLAQKLNLAAARAVQIKGERLI